MKDADVVVPDPLQGRIDHAFDVSCFLKGNQGFFLVLKPLFPQVSVE
jgi:hypothetical protein